MLEIPIKKSVHADAQFDMTGFQGAGMYQDMFIDDEDQSRSFRWEDGDTVYDNISDEGYRFLGIDALETDHIGHSDKQGFKSGEYGGGCQVDPWVVVLKVIPDSSAVDSWSQSIIARLIGLR